MAYSLTYTYNSASQSYSVTGGSNITTTDNVVIPSTYDDGTNGSHLVTTISSYAFNGCNSLTSVVIPDSVTNIGNAAFYGCTNLTGITIPDSITSIGNSVFKKCRRLKSIIVGENNQNYKSIDGNLYTKDGATLIQYAIGKTERSFEIPAGVTIIDSDAFYDCISLTNITIPNSVVYIRDNAFYGCTNLTSVTIGNSVIHIGDNAFYGCSSLTNIVIPDSVKSIGSYAFYGCTNLTSVTIGTGVTSIGSDAFRNCSRLTSITIPNSVTSIGSYAFNSCINLKTIVLFPETPPTLGSNAIPTTTAIYVQQSSKEAYKAATNWTSFANKIESNDIYLSLIRFNKKNKEYISEKINILKEYVDESINKSIITVLNTEV